MLKIALPQQHCLQRHSCAPDYFDQLGQSAQESLSTFYFLSTEDRTRTHFHDMSCESHVPRFVMLVFYNKDGVEPEHICYGKVLKPLLNFVREPVKTI